MDEKLKELLDRAREGGASAEQLREIIRTYKSNNATSPKGEVAEGENGGLESPSADTASSSDSPQQYRLATPEELDDYIASGGIITESQQMKDQKKALEEYEKQVKAKEREAMGRAVQDVINRNKFPELMKERDSLVKQMESMPIMATGELDARVKEIDEIINAKPKSYRKIRQERLDELDSLIAEQEQKDYRLGANGAYLENNGTYEQLQKERKQVKADVDNQTALLDKLRDDTTITDQFIRFYTPKFLEKYVTPENEQVKLSDEVEEKLLLKLDSDKRLKSKVDMGGKNRTYISLAERENLIKQAKEEVLVEKGKEIKEEYDAIIEKSKGLDQEKDAKELFKLQKQIDLLNERNDELLFTYGYDKVNNQFNDVFKRTTRSKDYDESLGQGGADVGSTFVEGLANVVLDGTVGFAGWLGSLGDAFTDDDSYSIFDAVGDTAYELSNNNLLPSSKSEQGSLVDKDGNWNVSLYSVGKAGAEGLPFTLALINDARKGNVRNMYKKLGNVISPKRMNTLSQSLQMAEKAYKITVSDNRKEAFDNGLDGTQAIAYSNFQSMATGLTQMIMPDTKFFKTPAGKVVLNKFANDLKGAATREAIKKASLNFLGNLGKEIGEEELEGAISEVIKFGMLQNHSSEFLTAKYQKELIGNTLVVSGALGGAGFKSNVEANKTKLYKELNTNYEGLISDIDNMIDSSNDEKFIEMLNKSKKLIGDVKEATNKSPKDVTGKQIDLLIEKKELIQEMKSMDDSFHPEYKEKIEKINENIRKEASLKESKAVNDTDKTKTETKQGESKTESEEKVGYDVSEQLKSHNDNEGSTFTLDGKNRSGEKGVSSVSIFPERSKIIDGEITEQDISEFKEANKDLLEGNEDVLAIGTWFDKKSGKTYLDVSAVTDTDSAIKLGEQYNQKAVFNLETFEEIDTKGDGTPIKNLKSEVDRVSDIRSILNESNKKSTEVQATTEGARANETGTDKSVDGNVQQDIKEDKEIKPVLAAVRAMVSVSEKAESLRELKAKLKDLTSSGLLTKFQSKSLINRALGVDPTNEKQVDKFVDYFAKQMGKATTRDKKNKYGSKLKGVVKKAIRVQKKKIGHIGQNILELSRIRPESIPEEHIENYYNVMEAVSKNKYVKEDVDALYADLKEAIIKDVEARNEEREVNRSKDPKDTSELIVEAKKAISKSYDTSLLNDSEKTILKKLKGLGNEYIEQLSAKKLRQISNDLEILSEYGYLPNKNISSIVTFSEGVKIANEIKGKVGDKLLHVSSGLVQEINRIFGKKEQSVKTMIQRFQNKMGQHTDALIKGVKGTDFYTNIVHPISAGLQTATEKTLETGGKLELLIKKAKIKDKFDFNVKLQLLFRQLEYDNNPVFRGKKVFKVSEHIKATQELFDKGKSQYSEESVNTINKVYEQYKNEDGEIDVDKLEKSLSAEEMKIVNFIKEHLSETANKRRDLDSNMLGENTLLLEEYFPRQNDSGVKQKGGYMDYIKQVFNSSSVKPQAAKERKVNGANALDFTTLSHFMSHIKDSNVESHISPSMKRVGIVLSQLQDSDNKSLVKVAMALEKSINKLVDVHMGKNIYAAKSKNDKLIQTLLSKTFNKMLMSNTRAVIDNISQNATLFLLNADRIGAIRKSREKMKGISKSIMDDYSSTQRERIGGNRAVDFQEGISTDLTKAKWSKKDPSKRDKAIDLLNKNKVSELGDRYAKAYYQVVDFSAKFFWDFHFLNNFEKTTGEAFDADKYKKDADYKIKFDKAIRQSVANTDKQISNIYNTGAQSEQKLKVQIGSKNRDFKTRINSFMQSFSFNENSVWWDSLMSMMGKEGGTIESQQEAFRTFMTVNIRSMTYGYLSMTLFNSFAAALGLLDDDDELEEKAIKRTLAQHGMLIAFGNKGSIFNMGAAYIFENWIHKNMVKSQGGKYNGYEDSLLYAQQERGTLKSHLGTLGAEGQLMQNFMDVGELVTKMMMEYDKTGSISEDKLIDFKAAKIGITTLAQLTGLPIDRLGKQWQNMMSDDLKQRKEAIKKKEKKKKSKKSAFAF